MQLRNAIVFITGANRGLGRALAEAALDVTAAAQVARAAERCADVTLLINNAGISRQDQLLGAVGLPTPTPAYAG